MSRYAHVPSASLGVSTLARAAISSSSVEAAEAAMSNLLDGRPAVVFASARGALAAAIRATVPPGAVVQVPAYTCVAVPNAVRSAGCELAWVDVDAVGRPGFAAGDAQALLAQDTLGFPCAPAPAEAPVIRDASHRADVVLDPLPGVRVTVTSFEHSKSLSAGLGGLAVMEDAALAQAMRRLRDEAPARGSSLRHAAVTLAGLLSGRALFAGRRSVGLALHSLAGAIDGAWMRGQDERETAGQGVRPSLLGRPTPLAAQLMLSQLAACRAVAEHRRQIVATYDAALDTSRAPLPLVRYPLAVDDRERANALFRAAGWELGRPWFDGLVHPAETNLSDFGLDATRFPAASRLAATMLNLPTHPLVRPDDAQELARLAIATGARPLVAD